jgi:hypothetical protein
MSNVRNEGKKDLAPTPEPTTAQGGLQRIRQDLFRQRRREHLEKTRWRRPAEPSAPGENEPFVRCPKCGETLGRL